MAFDRRWHRRALDGDGAAVREMADASLIPLYRFSLYRVGGRAELAEEVVQETMVRAIHDLDRYDPDRSRGEVLPWLFGLARNQIRRVLKRFAEAGPLENLWMRVDRELVRIFVAIDEEPFADEVIEREETRQVVGATMAQLPDDYRRALEAKYLEGKSVREIAAGDGISEKAAESRLARSRAAFKEVFAALVRSLEAQEVSHG